MRTLRSYIRSLSTMPRGFNADGRALGLGLDAALRLQRAHGAEIQPLVPSTSVVHDERHSRVS
jgi:hypothetical protein